MRAVLDPNVVISGWLSPGGSPARVLFAWDSGRFELLVSPLVLDELRRALAYRKLRSRIPPEVAERAISWLEASANLVDDPKGGPPVRSEDPGDDYLVALAADQHAALVSGDKHLLALNDLVPVYSAGEFLGLLEESSPN